jgi:hypothetical protein
MPICPDRIAADGVGKLQRNADKHIEAQRGVLERLKLRLTSMERQALDLDPESDRGRRTKEGIALLRRELNGEVWSDEANTWVRDAAKEPAYRRLDVMARLYKDRPPREFTYTNSAGEERTSAVYGLPTIEEFEKAGAKEAIEEMVVRSLSLVETGDTTRNPYDYLQTSGLEVKDALDRGIEHHHIYNNVVVNPDGSVVPKSVNIRVNPTTGEPELHVVPAYHGYNYTDDDVEESMDSVQFVCLMDAMHSGDDPLAHLHLYEFEGSDAEYLKEKMLWHGKETAASATARIPKLEAEIADLEARQENPQHYEQQLLSENSNALIEKGEIISARRSHPDKDSPEYAALGDRMNQLTKQIKGNERKLAKHTEALTLRDTIATQESEVIQLRTERKQWSGKASYAKKKKKEGAELTDEQNEAIAKDKELATRYKQATINLKSSRDKLAKSGDLGSVIAAKKKSLASSQRLAQLDDRELTEIWEKSNGFFSFNKGNTESKAHTKFRPAMNSEINKFAARSALEYIQKSGADVQEIYARQYQQNLLHRLSGITSRIV